VRITELHLEQFKKEGVDYDIKHAKTRWRELLADIRYLFNNALPRIWKGEKWGDWQEEDCLRYGGKIIDALRSVYFPLIPPSKDDPRYNTSYWKAYRKAEKKGYIKSKPPKLEEVSEWDKKRKEIIKTSLEEAERKIDGLYLTYPHGELFWTKEKTLLVKTRKFDLSKPHYLIDDGFCYGIISFKEPKRITKKQFFTEDLKKKHRILDTEAWQWWRMSRDNAVEPELWAYEVKKFEPFEIPERVKIPKGTQVIVDADNIEFVGKDEEQPARIDWPIMATKEAKTDYIKFYGTKGYIEEENNEHKYHTCILLSLNDTNILLDYGERHPEEIKERIDVILNSHRHIDHICPEISSFACPLYISKETLNRVDFSLPEDIRIYEARKAFSIGNIKIITYPVYHSIRAPMHIFKIETDNLAIGVMTDFLAFEEVEDEEFFYPNLDIVIIDGSSITKDLRRWKEDHNLIFGHKSVIHQIERIRDRCEKNPIIILTHIGREGIEWGDLQILQYLHERFAGMHIYIAKDGSVFDLKTRRFTEAFKGEQICKDIVANLPSFTWIPEFTSITGSTLFTKDHAPRDLDVMCKAEEINGKWYIPVDTSLLLKLQRAYQYATKKVLGKAIKPEFPPPALIGANWSSIPAYDLKLVPRKNPEVRRTGEEEFEEKVYGVDFKEKLRLRTKSKDIEKMAQQSLEEDKVKPLRFFMPLKPIRVQGKHGERNTPERLVELFEPQHYPVYNSVKRDGFRVQIHADGDKVVIYSEDGNDITKQLPTIVDAVKRLKAKSVVLDAEVELWENGYHHPREAAIAKIHSKAIDDKDLIANLFDCIYLNGEDLHKEPFEKRWKASNSLGIKYSKETNLNPEEKLNIIPHILCKTPKELLRETERMRKVKSSEGCVAIAHNATYPLDGKPDDNSFCKFHNNVVIRGIVIEPVQTKVSTVYNLSFGCLAGKHEILKKDQTEVGPYEKVLTIGSTFAAPYVKRGSVIEVECETINHIIHEDIEGNPVEITAWAPRFMRVVPGAKPDSIDDILRKARKENHVLQEKIIKSDGTVIYKEARKELYCFLTEEPTLTSKISDRFGAAKYAIFFEPATYHFEAIDLSNFVTGIEITDLIKERRATEVVTNQIGRFSREALDKAGIKIVFAQGKVEDYLNKKLGESPLLKEAILREQDPYMQYFDEDKEHKFCAQHHYRCALKEVLKEIGREDLWPREEPSPEEWAKLWPKWWPEVRKVLEDYYDTHPNFEHSPSVHCDLRMETDTKGVLIGFTLNDQIKDRPQFFPLRLRKSEGKYSAEEYDDDPENWKINYNTGEFAKRVKKGGAKAPVSLISERKAQEPSSWLTYEGFQSPRNVAATRYGYALLHLIRKLGIVETGMQLNYFHEYFLHFPRDGNKPPFYWRLMFRYLKRPFKEAIEKQDYETLSECVYLEDGEDLEEGIYLEAERIIPVSEEGWGRNQAGWLCIYGVDKTPYIISDRAVKLKRMCPYPYSALPRYIKKQIPPEFHYWKEKDMKKRIEIRDALVKAIKEKKVILKESIARDYILQLHYSEPAELIKRKSPAHKHWDLRIDGDLKKKTGHIFHAVLELNPLEVDSTSAYLKKCKGDEGGVNWMEVGKDKTVKFTKGYGTFEKNEPGYVKALDWGRVLVLEDSPLFKKFQFKGKQLKGIWIMHRSSPETDIWTFERSKDIG